MRTVQKSLNFVFLIALTLGLIGCSSFGRKVKSFLGGKPSPSPEARAPKRSQESFNNSSTILPNQRRAYRRMTKKSLENQSNLDASSGSLWVMEGQGAFLFSQNIMRMIGDPLAIRIDGEPRQQLNAKVKVIKKLLAKLDARRKALARRPSAAKKGKKGEKADGEKKETTQKSKDETLANGKDDSGEFSVKRVPTRIVERLVDGSYRVKGSQPFMIGPKEYKVIVTGLVRAEDFADEGVSASKLIDPKFDIVSLRKREARL